MTISTDKNILDHLKSNWLVYCFILQIVVTWVTFNARLASAETSIAELQQSDKDSKLVLAQVNSKLSNIDVNVAQIQTSLEWIKKGDSQVKCQ